ncbi:MAG: hypothetical protein JKY94_08750 [Rhodobacteraceae bacterium]|nr:hypothetical protein [Paracoccaceae bacterium]
MHRFDGDDRQLERALGVSRSTVWRLRNGKISKLGKYIIVLEDIVDQRFPKPMDAILDDLRLWSNDSKELQEILTSLHKVLQETATH